MRIFLTTVSAILAAAAATLSREQLPTPARLRDPVALALTSDGRWLFAANQRSGTVSILDTQSLKLAGEVPAGRRLADLALTPDAQHLLTVDEEPGELIVLARQESALRVRRRVPVRPGPVSVCTDGTSCVVASLWQRQLTVIDLAPLAQKGAPPRVLGHHALPLAPRKMLLLPNSGKLVLADAFGGRLAVFDPRRGEVESVRTLPAHNIRGLAVSTDGKNLRVAQQVLHRLAETTRDNVHWGNVITNNLRVLPLRDVLDSRADVLHDSRLHQLGEAGRGSGDPAGVAATADGTLAVALAGVGELAVGPDRLGNWDRIKVGSRPTAVVASPDGRRVYVAYTFGDSVSVVDVRERSVLVEISLGPQPPALSPSERGERLFYDARLTHDGWMSCHSCHTDGHTNGLLSDTLGDGSYGAPKRVLSLLGVRDTAPYAWNGSVPDLESQIRKSVATTMHGPKLADGQVRDLAAYLRMLAPPPPLHCEPLAPASGERGRGEGAERIRRGQAVFEKQGCTACHAAPTYTSAKTYDIGLKDEMGNRQFNPPSLRGVGQASAFFHDGRAATLEEVVAKHGHPLKSALPEEELRDLLAFLRSL